MTLERELMLIAIIAPVIHLVGALHALHAVMRVNSPQGAIAWALLLVFFPYFAIPLYIVFGPWSFRDFRRSMLLALRQQRPCSVFEYEVALAPPYTSFGRVVSFLAKQSFTRGNQVELLVDGEQFFPRLFSAINNSKQSVLVEFFILRDDATGSEFFAALEQAAARGVKVHLLYDPIGSISLDDDVFGTLLAAGVQVAAFHTTRGSIMKRFRLNYRNHRKIAVIDGTSAIIGGFNIGDEYRGKNFRGCGWRDTGLTVQGPVVAAIEGTFFLDWCCATGSNLALLPSQPTVADASSTTPSEVFALSLATGPVGGNDECGMLCLTAIEAALSRIIIATPYFVPDDAILRALRRAVIRGVEVTIMLPNVWDHFLVQLAALYYADCANRAGCRVVRYKDGFMHQKVTLVDDTIVIIGSSNWDERSFRLNFEHQLIVADAGFAKQVEVMLARDLLHCTPAPTSEFAMRPFPVRLAAHIARLFSPVL